MTSRLIAQMKAASSRAIAVATMVGRLPFRVSERKRPHNLICAFQAISRTARGAAATFICFSRLTNTWRIPIAPCGFDQDTPRPAIASLGDTAAVDRVSCGAFGGHETEIPHQLAGVLKARQIADLGQHRHCRNKIDPAHRLQSCDDLGKGPLGHRVTDRLLQTLDTLALLAHRPQKLFEHNPLLAMLELLQHKPIHVGRAPRLLAWKSSSEPKHERGDLLPLAFEVFPRCLAGA